MRLLNGRELAGFIKERQAKQVRSLRQSKGINPKLAIVVTDVDNPVIDVYMRLKHKYGTDILIDVDIHKVPHSEAETLLNKLSEDESVHAIIVQLPLAIPEDTDKVIGLINPHKDVDGLVDHSDFEPATALAIMWLLVGYNVDLVGKNVVLVGHGKLVGQPLEKLMIDNGVTPTIVDKSTENPNEIIGQADVVVSATGVAGLIKPDMLKHGAVVVDAGVASEGGKTVGDVAPEVYEERDDLTITPTKGGVGPLTVCALFENVIRAAQKVADKQGE
ncbi:MAG: tetrahydrofolate dehydrogenase/cyclohydrolase catalytic domain-containing protein [Candidatus Saccharimonadales bacterium]